MEKSNIRKLRKQNSSYIITLPAEYINYCKLDLNSLLWVNLIDKNTILIKKVKKEERTFYNE
jgi:hypothetical protein